MKYLIIAFVATLLLAGSAYAQESIVLSSDDPADQAIGEILAQRLNTTLVTTPWGTLREGAVTQIGESNATRVLVVGGGVAVPDVEETIDMDIKRLAGKDRYHTSALAASLWNSSGEAIVVEGRDEQAIKEALKEARQQGAPLLFTMNDHIPEEVREKLRELKVREARFIPSPNMNASDIREEMEEEEVEVQESEVDFEERAREAVEDAEEAVAEAEFNVSNATGPGEMAAANLLTNAREHLKKAESALNQSKYGRAFGLATAAEHEAKAASRIRERIVVGYYREEVEEAEGLIDEHGLERAREALESARERIEEEESEEDGEEEFDEMADSLEKKLEILEKREEKLEEAREKVEEARERAKAGRQENGKPVEIEAEISGSNTLVEAEIKSREYQFSLNVTSREEVVNRIAEKLNMSTVDVSQALEFKEEKESEDKGEEEDEGQESEEGEEAGEAQEASLHGFGKCDQCHGAPTMEDMAAGEHAEAFEEQPGTHKPLCSQCHDVETFCTKCHGLPEVMQ